MRVCVWVHGYVKGLCLIDGFHVQLVGMSSSSSRTRTKPLTGQESRSTTHCKPRKRRCVQSLVQTRTFAKPHSSHAQICQYPLHSPPPHSTPSPHPTPSQGQMTLDDILHDRKRINDHVKATLAEQSDPWGLRVLRYVCRTCRQQCSHPRSTYMHTHAHTFTHTHIRTYTHTHIRMCASGYGDPVGAHMFTK